MKKLGYILVVAVLLLGLSTAVYAQGLPVVVDNAGLLTSTQADQVARQLEQLQSSCGIDAVVLTVNSLDGMSAMDYADDYYDSHGYGNDGVLLLVAMAEREWWISTSGKCINGLSIADLEDDFAPLLSDGQYCDAFITFARGCEKMLLAQQDGDPASTDSSGASRKATGKTVLICLGIGVAVGLIAVLVMKGQLKTVRGQSAADSYVSDNLKLTGSADQFLYLTTTRRPKPQDNSTHRSSSGRSHGGGGGRF